MLDRILNGVDFSILHVCLAWIGMFASVYVMQLISYEDEDGIDPPFIRNIRRFSYGILALAMGWSILYSEAKYYKPWPPDVLVFIAIDMILLNKILAVYARIRRVGRRPNSMAARRSVKG